MIWCLETGRHDGGWKKGKDKKTIFKQWIAKYGQLIVEKHGKIMQWEPYAHCFDYNEIKNMKNMKIF